MFNINYSDFSHIMAVALFILGLITLVIGIFVLFKKVMGDELKVIANQTTKLAQKGIAEDVAGLVGNASALISELNQFVRTSSGIGIFLSIIGGVLIGASYMLIQQFK
jgi:hypothetical protein